MMAYRVFTDEGKADDPPKLIKDLTVAAQLKEQEK
jgi:hypothetical protein